MKRTKELTIAIIVKTSSLSLLVSIPLQSSPGSFMGVVGGVTGEDSEEVVGVTGEEVALLLLVTVSTGPCVVVLGVLVVVVVVVEAGDVEVTVMVKAVVLVMVSEVSS